MGYRVAVLGATGLVGRTLLELLEERSFPAAEVIALASERSAGRRLPFRGREIEVRRAEPRSFEGVDLVLASAGAAVSRELVPAAARRGAVAIDNTAAFRMEPEVPLVVPEVNGHRVEEGLARGIIANPNCSTIQLVMVLKPLHDAFGVRRAVVSTYQSVSGAGARALAELEGETRADLDGRPFARQVFPKPIAFNPIPHIDRFLEGGETREEWKMRVETPKIMEADIPVLATCVRVPVRRCHCEAVWVETARRASPEEVRERLAGAPGLAVVDDPEGLAYPTAVEAAGRDEVFVGRVRRDPTHANGIALWIVADNIRKGAALNAVQIGECVVRLWAGSREGAASLAARA